MSKKIQKPIILIISAVVIFIAGYAIKIHSGQDQELAYPMTNFEQRPKLLTFGLYVTPDSENNPIDPPERFSGYHTALDLEIHPGEENENVSVFAICEGPLIDKRTAEGYGGVLVQACSINNQTATVIYGHLDPNSFEKDIGEQLLKSEKIAILGDHKTEETGNTRKHLHLGIHKGSQPVFAGYVMNEEELENFIDPLPLFN